MIDCEVSLVLHRFPVAEEEVNITELPEQIAVGPLAETVTTGVVFGAATPEPAALTQPFTVLVTE